jgi:cell division protein FtsL
MINQFMKSKKNESREKKAKNTISLLSSIFIEVFIKNWLLVLLIMVTVISSMQKARTSHNSRRAIAKLELLKEESQQLQIEWQSLKLEMTAVSENNRITQLAMKELGMVTVNSSNEKIISL